MNTRLSILGGACVVLALAPASGAQVTVTPDGVVATATATGATPPANCAFRRAAVCPVTRDRGFNIYGPYLDVSARRGEFDLEISDFSGVPERPLLNRLRTRRGTNVRVAVKPRTRIFIVRPDHSRARAKRAELFAALYRYERAPVYVTGTLGEKSHWDDAKTRLRASLVTLDLSDGAVANLVGQWAVREDPTLRVTLTSTQSGLRKYTGEVRTVDGQKVATVTLSQPTTGTVCLVDWLPVGQTTAEQFDCGRITGNGQVLGPMASRTVGRPSVTLTQPG